MARRSSISLSLAAVSTGFAAPKIFAAGVGAGAWLDVDSANLDVSELSSTGFSAITIGSIGFVRGCSCNFGLVRVSAK